MKTTFEKITTILVDKMGLEQSEITLDANLIKDLGIDSLDYSELVMEFEQEFDIRIPDSDAALLITIKDVITYIDSKIPTSVK